MYGTRDRLHPRIRGEQQKIMPVSKIGRIHLIYQFIILTMLVMFIGYELLSERKYASLSIICIFIFALMILSCYTELSPVHAFLFQYSTSESLESKEESCKGASELPNDTTQGKADTEQNQNSESSSKPRAYRLRNWKKNSSIENKSAEKSYSIFDASSIVPMENIREYNFGSYGSKQSDLTKRYYFPFRQKRLEEWVDSKESRPYKIRPQKYDHPENAKPTTDSFEVSSTKNPDKSASSVTNHPQSPDLALPKSYSFPFRRRRLEHWMEMQETEKENLEITSSLPQWETMDYSEYDPEFRMRRSFSGSALNSEEDSATIDKEKNFSQSVEIASVANSVGSSVPTSPSNAFDKIKAGFKEYFSKRKHSFKGNTAKVGYSKRRHFKSFFQSKENISLDAAEKMSPKVSSGEYYKF